ncbi:MAG: tetratricopeptide repeat protein [Planctomycetes bacterium]|nr:tetratricopeptide repeat protein [Planctomycetota bacterium]
MSRFANLETAAQGHDAVRVDPRMLRDEHHFIALAEDAFRSARFELAMRFYSRALETDPNCQAGWSGQVRSLLELGELDEARVWAAKALESFRDHRELLASRAVACARLGHSAKAFAFSDAAVQQPQPTAWVWISRGEIMLATGRGTDAFCFDKARELANGDWLPPLLVARAYLYYRNPGRGLQWAREAQAIKPDTAFSAHVIGACNDALGHHDAARAAYAQALDLDRDFPPTRAALDTHARMTWKDHAIAAWKHWRNRP